MKLRDTMDRGDVKLIAPVTKIMDELLYDAAWDKLSGGTPMMRKLLATTDINGRPAQFQLYLTTNPYNFINKPSEDNT